MRSRVCFLCRDTNILYQLSSRNSFQASESRSGNAATVFISRSAAHNMGAYLVLGSPEQERRVLCGGGARDKVICKCHAPPLHYKRTTLDQRCALVLKNKMV